MDTFNGESLSTDIGPFLTSISELARKSTTEREEENEEESEESTENHGIRSRKSKRVVIYTDKRGSGSEYQYSY
ncbi:hypothetical protein CKAN_02722400 [Cinnamomum micranthum f. kanehirae]|uniref:Uncharacterized protein n=1 Tax=Cinnamomum micranthum f. kanehirae TaxID=337451 RepID=A0A443Q445_9MAGN|nr:hypothetical protein CKAN_02722400 [Cinnamomum micranthum f. kanehirae]